MPDLAALHDAYAADYDEQTVAYGCYLAEALFGLSYEFVSPGERLLDVGIGSGLAAAPFAKGGLRVYGLDFSAAMLEQCRAKGIAVELKRHDIQQFPWPYSAATFDHVVCCGVLHFIGELEPIFAEVRRVMRGGGVFAFTTKAPSGSEMALQGYEQTSAGGLSVFSHAPAHVAKLFAQNRFQSLKVLQCFVGEEMFYSWLVQRIDLVHSP